VLHNRPSDTARTASALTACTAAKKKLETASLIGRESKSNAAPGGPADANAHRTCILRKKLGQNAVNDWDLREKSLLEAGGRRYCRPRPQGVRSIRLRLADAHMAPVFPARVASLLPRWARQRAASTQDDGVALEGIRISAWIVACEATVVDDELAELPRMFYLGGAWSRVTRRCKPADALLNGWLMAEVAYEPHCRACRLPWSRSDRTRVFRRLFVPTCQGSRRQRRLGADQRGRCGVSTADRPVVV
jgi:hypothetical protein